MPIVIVGDPDVEADETFGVALTNPVAATLARATATGTILDDDRPLRLYNVTPCRVVDTRWAPGSHGGLAIGANSARTLALAGSCGVPASARAVSLDVTVTGATARATCSSTRAPRPCRSPRALSFGVGITRANNAVVFLGSAGSLGVRSGQASGSVQVVLDVSGYFE